MGYPFRHSICNEIFHPPGVESQYTFGAACKKIREIGYSGIEIAPFTLSDAPQSISIADRQALRSTILNEGLQFVGLHWLMLSPKGLHVTTPDNQLREPSWNHVRNLIDLCSDLGGNSNSFNGVLVFGSPGQRNSTGGSTPEDSAKRFRDGFAAISRHAEERHVTVLVEALPRAQSDIVNTLAEAVEIVEYCASPAIQTMFDSHNAADETEPHSDVIEKNWQWIRHIHVNEMDGKHCGRGNYDFKTLLEVLARKQYRGWVSLEAFDFSFGSETIARESLAHLQAQQV
jgi:D-psicose/D-tagatose/L-ribulose 3-epimerase